MSINCDENKDKKFELIGDIEDIEDIDDDIDEIVNFLNKGLSEGKKVIDLRDELNIGEKKLQKKLRENNYKFNSKERQYIKLEIDDGQKKLQTNYNGERDNNGDQLQSNYNMNTNQPQINYNKRNGVTTNQLQKSSTMDQEILDTISTVKELKEMTSKVEEMYKWYKLQTEVIEIEIPKLEILKNDSDTVTRSLRLYADTNERFIKFCKDNKENKVQDILNTALVEFLNRYEKN
ncbi:hypothetical protein [Intestinibacter sp.]|uniref:hypothetical protein n=1 Tax=Intestinibacter sp. TaxID=1965304 RepID=UPI003F15D4FA